MNPGRLISEQGGTFAKILITPPSKESADQQKIGSYMGCQIQRI